MSWVTMIGDAIRRHEDWSTAIAHVAACLGIGAEDCWFQAGPDAACLFGGPPSEGFCPVALVLDPVQYQSARSRGELENIHPFF